MENILPDDWDNLPSIPSSGRSSNNSRLKRYISSPLTEFKIKDKQKENNNEAVEISSVNKAQEEKTDKKLILFEWKQQDFNFDLNEEVSKRKVDLSDRGLYLNECKIQDVVPISQFLNSLNKSQVTLKYRSIGLKDIIPIAVALKVNNSITSLILSNNCLGDDEGVILGDLLLSNSFISELDVSNNQIGFVGVRALAAGLQNSTTIKILNLSGNVIGDKGMVFLGKALTKSSSLEKVYLNKNKIGDKSGLSFKSILANNTSIKELDLSWNSIRQKGAVFLAKGLSSNVMLKKLNFANNGICNTGAHHIGIALATNYALEELDLRCNRIAAEGAVLLGKGLTLNETLKILKLGWNHMFSPGAYAICNALLKNPSSALQLLDLSEIYVNRDFNELFYKIQTFHPDLKIIVGSERPPKKTLTNMHPMSKLEFYLKENNQHLKDIFSQFDKNSNKGITKDDFALGMQDIGFRITPEDIDQVFNDLDTDRDGKLFYSDVVVGIESFGCKEAN